MTRRDENGGEGISDLLRRIVLASVGAAAVGKDELDEFIRRAREQGDITSADAQKLKDKLSESFKRVPGGWEEAIDKSIRAALRRLDIPDRGEIERLQETIDRLTRKIEGMQRARSRPRTRPPHSDT